MGQRAWARPQRGDTVESSEAGAVWILVVVEATRGYTCGKPAGSPAPTPTHILLYKSDCESDQ